MQKIKPVSRNLNNSFKLDKAPIKFSLPGKQIIILISVFVVGAVIGAVISFALTKETVYNEGLAEGKRQIEEEYQKKIEEVFPALPEEKEILSIQGKITEIKDKTLSLETTLYSANPFEEPKTKVWLVKIDDSTEIVKRVMKSPEEMEREEEDYNKALESLGETEELLPIPSPDKDISIKFDELKVGDEINAQAKENIKAKVEFIAKKIILQPSIESNIE